ncbi:hypothetical protein GGX14DRAFT_395448 [Mycena pura]|uniref:Uncharacterized protein n=1 Tax=Mycena pura TaxID=153505 RepID=A0AAD6VG55_9AGAR|nr:hypothetical protein GGX14DRAFT_395448 [Mycena pura]
MPSSGVSHLGSFSRITIALRPGDQRFGIRTTAALPTPNKNSAVVPVEPLWCDEANEQDRPVVWQSQVDTGIRTTGPKIARRDIEQEDNNGPHFMETYVEIQWNNIYGASPYLRHVYYNTTAALQNTKKLTEIALFDKQNSGVEMVFTYWKDPPR